jgi:hypothetical protein
LAVHPTDGAGHQEFYLMCDDIAATVEELKKKKIEVTRPMEDARWGRVTAIKLPGGGELGLYQPKHPTALGLKQRSKKVRASDLVALGNPNGKPQKDLLLAACRYQHRRCLATRGLFRPALFFDERGDAFAGNPASLEPVPHMRLRVAHGRANEIVGGDDPFAGAVTALAALLQSPAMFYRAAGAHAIFVDTVIGEAWDTEHVYSHGHIIARNRPKV